MNNITDNQQRDIVFALSAISDGIINIEKEIKQPDASKESILSQVLKISIMVQSINDTMLTFNLDRESKESQEYFNNKMNEFINKVNLINEGIRRVIEVNNNG